MQTEVVNLFKDHNINRFNTSSNYHKTLKPDQMKDIFCNSLTKLLLIYQDLDQQKRNLFANPDFNIKKLYNLIETKN